MDDLHSGFICSGICLFCKQKVPGNNDNYDEGVVIVMPDGFHYIKFSDTTIHANLLDNYDHAVIMFIQGDEIIYLEKAVPIPNSVKIKKHMSKDKINTIYPRSSNISFIYAILKKFTDKSDPFFECLKKKVDDHVTVYDYDNYLTRCSLKDFDKSMHLPPSFFVSSFKQEPSVDEIRTKQIQIAILALKKMLESSGKLKGEEKGRVTQGRVTRNIYVNIKEAPEKFKNISNDARVSVEYYREEDYERIIPNINFYGWSSIEKKPPATVEDHQVRSVVRFIENEDIKLTGPEHALLGYASDASELLKKLCRCFEIVETKGDGHCLFHAFVMATYHKKKYMYDCGRDFRLKLFRYFNFKSDRDVFALTNPRDYATDIDVAFLSDFFRLNIIVIAANIPKRTTELQWFEYDKDAFFIILVNKRYNKKGKDSQNDHFELVMSEGQKIFSYEALPAELKYREQ
jgi:hypothetical protein